MHRWGVHGWVYVDVVRAGTWYAASSIPGSLIRGSIHAVLPRARLFPQPPSARLTGVSKLFTWQPEIAQSSVSLSCRHAHLGGASKDAVVSPSAPCCSSWSHSSPWVHLPAQWDSDVSIGDA